MNKRGVKKQTGVIFGKFFPVHTGHINMVFEALDYVERLHIFVCSETTRDQALLEHSQMQTFPSVSDRLRWMQIIFGAHKNITIHHLNEDGIAAYPDGWSEWTTRAYALMESAGIKAELIFSSEPQDQQSYQTLFNSPVILVDSARKKFHVSATKIRTNPFDYWHFIPPIIRPLFIKRIIVISKSIATADLLSDQLAKTYNTNFLSAFHTQSVSTIEQALMNAYKIAFFTGDHHSLASLADQTDFKKSLVLLLDPIDPDLEIMLKELNYNLITLLENATKTGVFGEANSAIKQIFFNEKE